MFVLVLRLVIITADVVVVAAAAATQLIFRIFVHP